jgi:hypothetical protein
MLDTFKMVQELPAGRIKRIADSVGTTRVDIERLHGYIYETPVKRITTCKIPPNMPPTNNAVVGSVMAIDEFLY